MLLLFSDLEPLIVGIVDSLVTTESSFVCFVEDHVVGAPICSYQIMFIRIIRMEVKHIDELSLLIHNELIAFIR